jgi:peptide/nickel transport system ATP-binding protein
MALVGRSPNGVQEIEDRMSTPLLDVRDLTVDLLPNEGGEIRLVDHVSFSLAPGEVLGVAGESGSGKTLTALSIMRLLSSKRIRLGGEVLFQGRDMLTIGAQDLRQTRGSQIAMIFQDPTASIHPAWTVGAQIVEQIRAHEDISQRAAHQRAVDLLDLVRIPDPGRNVNAYAHEMSGGMLQRVMIGMALACQPQLLIADEPTTALDVTVQAQVLELLRELQQEFGMALMFVSHDLGLVASLCERTLIMYAGQVVEDNRVATLFADPGHPYTEALMSAEIRPEHRGGLLPAIPGFPPEPQSMPIGCRFAARCPHVRRGCVDAEPPVEDMPGGGRVRCIRHSELRLKGVRS